MGHLSVSLGNVLLSMCEELARTRYSLRQVLAVSCGMLNYSISLTFSITSELSFRLVGVNMVSRSTARS